MKSMFVESFLSAAEVDALLAALAELPWSRGTLMGHPVPRDEVWMGPYSYRFSGRTLNTVSWKTPLCDLRGADVSNCDFSGACILHTRGFSENEKRGERARMEGAKGLDGLTLAVLEEKNEEVAGYVFDSLGFPWQALVL